MRGKPTVMVRFEGLVRSDECDAINPGAIISLGVLREVAEVVVFTDLPDMSRASLVGWLRLWGVPHDDACNHKVDRPPNVAAVLDPLAVAVKRNPGFAEWDSALAGVWERLGLPADVG